MSTGFWKALGWGIGSLFAGYLLLQAYLITMALCALVRH